ncbi:MAG TPA: hypothetical protein VJN48_05920 [Terriglobales bacterium]|nr:hypothetical protein [Terriglobales bacterium]
MASAFPAQQIANQPQPVREPPLWRDWRFFLFLALILAPCFWQSRIQAGDLSSHLYNSWLALQIRSGAVHGISIVPQWTNVAFDWLLTWLLAVFGAAAAQRITASLCVLFFAGGAFAFISAASGRRPWFLAPCIAVLAYGFVFHIGFFNFYLSLGFCLWFLAAFWKGSPGRRAASTPLLALAWLSHPLPAVWAAGAAFYMLIASRMAEKRRLYLLGAGIAVLLATQQFLLARYHTVWSPLQIFGITGADQALVYGRKYVIVTAGLLLLWLVWLRRLLKESGGRAGLPIPAQLLLLTAVGVMLIPTRIDFPRYGHALVYIADRMSLVAGVLLCVVLAEVRARRLEMIALAAVTVVFFGFLYADGAWANRQEDQIQAVVQQKIPRDARVVFLSSEKNLRLDPLAHVMDRVCVGRCFSYANYEPSTRQFRIRATENNGIVVTSYKDSYQLASGDYVVRPEDVPLYQVEACTPGRHDYCVRQLRAGEVNGHGGK